jgi:hypothetical protein
MTYLSLLLLPWVFGFFASAVIHPLVAEHPSFSPYHKHVHYDVFPNERTLFHTSIEQDLQNLEQLDCLTTNRFIDANNRGLYHILVPPTALDRIIETEQPSALEQRLLPPHILGPTYRLRPLGLTYLNFSTPVWRSTEDALVFVAKANAYSHAPKALEADLQKLREMVPNVRVTCVFDADAVEKVKTELEARKTSSCDEVSLLGGN